MKVSRASGEALATLGDDQNSGLIVRMRAITRRPKLMGADCLGIG